MTDAAIASHWNVCWQRGQALGEAARLDGPDVLAKQLEAARRRLAQAGLSQSNSTAGASPATSVFPWGCGPWLPPALDKSASQTLRKKPWAIDSYGMCTAAVRCVPAEYRLAMDVRWDRSLFDLRYHCTSRQLNATN